MTTSRCIGVFASLFVISTLLPAQYTEDRDNRNPTIKTWYYNISPTSLASKVNSGNRITDIEVVRVSPSLLFTVSLVPNAGSFKKGWWYYYGLTASDLKLKISTLKARLTDIEVYNTSSGQRFAVLLESNATNGKTWWWHYNSSIASIAATASANGARVTDIEQYTIGSSTFYAAILLKNTGADAKAWWWYFNVSAATVDSLSAANKARIWDLNRISPNRFNVVMVKFSGEYEWRLYSRTGQQVTAAMGQYGARVMDIEQYSTTFGPRFDVVLTNASNTASTRARDAMHAQGSGGTMGVYLRRVPGTGPSYTLAYINGNRRFEPASALKLLHHVTAMRDCEVSASMFLSKPMSVTYTTTSSSSCPVSTTAYTLTLRKVLEGMMRQSNNSFTRVITDIYGMSGLNLSATGLQLTDTQVNHHIGCGTPANYTTLVDLGKLHEQVIKGYLGSQREEFYSIMLSSFYSGNLKTVIDQEAAKVGLTTAQRSSFVANMRRSRKGGNYIFGSAKFHRASAAYVKLPIWVNGGMGSREYVTGSFVNDATNDSKAAVAVSIGTAEALRDEIHAAMLTLKDHVFGSFTSYGTSCKGAFATGYTHSALGTPELGQSIVYRASARRLRNTLSTLFVGNSKTTWSSIPLPFSLSFMNAPGCYFRTNALLQIGLPVVSGGVAISTTIPVSQALVGHTLHTQFLVLDPGANAANLIATNGITTVIGGQK